MKELRRYLADVLGASPDFRPIGRERVGGLPAYLLALYDLYGTELFGRELVLARAVNDGPGATAGEYATQLGAIQRTVGKSVALVLPSLASFERRALVKRGVPFVVPGRQLFLPQLMIDLRERFPRPGPPAGRALSAGAQCVLLTHLELQPVEDLSLRELAALVDYSPMAASNIAKELQAFGLCDTAVDGRSRRIRFTAQGRELWERAQSLLSSPVRKRHWLSPCPAGIPGVAAGLTALSVSTDVSDGAVPTHAVSERELRRLVEQRAVRLAEGPDDAIAILEGWAYDPLPLAKGGCVDPLSLCLSLRESPDERVRGALEEMLEKVPW